MCFVTIFDNNNKKIIRSRIFIITRINLNHETLREIYAILVFQTRKETIL